MNGDGHINCIRSEISDICLAAAATIPGIVTLSVPTGGGKTYASLRYALRHAAAHGQRRIFYIIPYNTILDQNAADIRAALDDYPSILEHHANVVLPTEDEQQAYRRLTERWDGDIIFTTIRADHCQHQGRRPGDLLRSTLCAPGCRLCSHCD